VFAPSSRHNDVRGGDRVARVYISASSILIFHSAERLLILC